MISSKCAVCDSKKSRFMKEQEASGLLSSLGIRAPLSHIPLLGTIFLFYQQSLWQFYSVGWHCEMNEIINIFLLEGDKSMPEMHLKQPGNTYSACGPFIKTRNDLDKACFRHDIAYGSYKDLVKIIESAKLLRDKVF